MQQPSLTLARRLRAPPQKVFAALTQPAHMMRWMQPADTECIHAQADARAGGAFRVVLREPDGTEHDVSGVYREVIENEKLVFTWTWRATPQEESLVTITLRADGDATELTLKHERFVDDATRDSHREGWSDALDQLVTIMG